MAFVNPRTNLPIVPVPADIEALNPDFAHALVHFGSACLKLRSSFGSVKRFCVVNDIVFYLLHSKWPPLVVRSDTIHGISAVLHFRDTVGLQMKDRFDILLRFNDGGVAAELCSVLGAVHFSAMNRRGRQSATPLVQSVNSMKELRSKLHLARPSDWCLQVVPMLLRVAVTERADRAETANARLVRSFEADSALESPRDPAATSGSGSTYALSKVAVPPPQTDPSFGPRNYFKQHQSCLSQLPHPPREQHAHRTSFLSRSSRPQDDGTFMGFTSFDGVSCAQDSVPQPSWERMARPLPPPPPPASPVVVREEMPTNDVAEFLVTDSLLTGSEALPMQAATKKVDNQSLHSNNTAEPLDTHIHDSQSSQFEQVGLTAGPDSAPAPVASFVEGIQPERCDPASRHVVSGCEATEVLSPISFHHRPLLHNAVSESATSLPPHIIQGSTNQPQHTAGSVPRGTEGSPPASHVVGAQPLQQVRPYAPHLVNPVTIHIADSDTILHDSAPSSTRAPALLDDDIVTPSPLVVPQASPLLSSTNDTRTAHSIPETPSFSQPRVSHNHTLASDTLLARLGGTEASDNQALDVQHPLHAWPHRNFSGSPPPILSDELTRISSRQRSQRRAPATSSLQNVPGSTLARSFQRNHVSFDRAKPPYTRGISAPRVLYLDSADIVPAVLESSRNRLAFRSADLCIPRRSARQLPVPADCEVQAPLFLPLNERLRSALCSLVCVTLSDTADASAALVDRECAAPESRSEVHPCARHELGMPSPCRESLRNPILIDMHHIPKFHQNDHSQSNLPTSQPSHSRPTGGGQPSRRAGFAPPCRRLDGHRNGALPHSDMSQSRPVRNGKHLATMPAQICGQRGELQPVSDHGSGGSGTAVPLPHRHHNMCEDPRSSPCIQHLPSWRAGGSMAELTVRHRARAQASPRQIP